MADVWDDAADHFTGDGGPEDQRLQQFISGRTSTYNPYSDKAKFGDAAARVLARLLGAIPSGRTLNQILRNESGDVSAKEAIRNGRYGDAVLHLKDRIVTVECKASEYSANVCIDDVELGSSEAEVLAAWVPNSTEIWWVTTMDAVRKIAKWNAGKRFWLICRDLLP